MAINKKINFLRNEEDVTRPTYIHSAPSNNNDGVNIDEKGWFIFFYSFLSLASYGCDKLLESKKFNSNCKYIIVGVVFNVKHSLEVLLKAFTRQINPDIDKSDRGHDLYKLYENFKKTKKIKGNVILGKNIKKLSSYITKYHELTFLSPYLKNSFRLNDLENTFFRYPENESQIFVDYQSFLSQVTKQDVEDIKKDIVDILQVSKKIKKIIK